MREGFIEAKSAKIWYAVYGEEKSGIPILVVQGGPGLPSMPEVFSDFSEERPVYFYDQLGSGKSDKAENPDDYSVDHFVEELEEVRQQLNLTEVILLGFSWGAALTCAYMLNKKPTGVKAVVLSSPYLSTPLWHRDIKKIVSRLPEDLIAIFERGEKNNDYGEEYQGAMFEFYRRHMYTRGHFPDSLMGAFQGINEVVYGTLWGPSELVITGKLKDFDLYPLIHEMEVPVLLTCGDRDELDVRTLRDYQWAFANASMAVLPGTGHMHYLEEPELYKAAVRSFLHRLP